MLATADVITAVSNVDKEIYNLMNHKSKVMLFSNTIDIDLYKNTYQHGGISMEEMLVPIITLRSKS